MQNSLIILLAAFLVLPGTDIKIKLSPSYHKAESPRGKQQRMNHLKRVPSREIAVWRKQ